MGTVLKVETKTAPDSGEGVASASGAGVTSVTGAGVTSASGAGVTSAPGAGVASASGAGVGDSISEGLSVGAKVTKVVAVGAGVSCPGAGETNRRRQSKTQPEIGGDHGLFESEAFIEVADGARCELLERRISKI